MAEPRGPVYLTLPREVLAEEHTEFSYTSPSRYTTESPPYPAPECIKEAAQALVSAKSPLSHRLEIKYPKQHGGDMIDSWQSILP
jgi:acetolactate synthase I/II/III large subunit